MLRAGPRPTIISSSAPGAAGPAQKEKNKKPVACAAARVVYLPLTLINSAPVVKEKGEFCWADAERYVMAPAGRTMLILKGPVSGAGGRGVHGLPRN